MPPKPKYTKEEIVAAAYELTRETGIDSVVARAVGKKLNTSASPIFTVFNSMEELKAEVVELGKANFRGVMEDLFDYTPAFKEFGMRWVKFALEEPNIYHLLFLQKEKGRNPYKALQEDFPGLQETLVQEVSKSFGIGNQDSEIILKQLLIHSHGLATITLDGSETMQQEAIGASISQICIGLVISAKLRDGTFQEVTAKAMARSAVKGVDPEL